MNTAPAPMVHTPIACFVFLGIAAVLWLLGSIRAWRGRRKTAKPKHHVVSWRVLYLRKAASRAQIRREVAPLEIQLADLAPLLALFPDPADAEEGDHARR